MRKINRKKASTTAWIVGKWSALVVVAVLVTMLSFAAPFSKNASADGTGAIVGAIATNTGIDLSGFAGTIAEIVAVGAIILEVFNELFGGIDGLNTQITQLFKLKSDVETKLAQAEIDAAGMLMLSDQYANIARLKSVAPSASREWCFQVHANKMDGYMDDFHKALASSLASHNDGSAGSFNTMGGHATADGKAPTNNTSQSMVERMREGCSIGALDTNDIKYTSVAGKACDNTLAKALGNVRDLGTDPQVMFRTSMYLPADEKPSSAGSTADDPGVKERLYRVQKFYCKSLRGDAPIVPVGTDINTPQGAALYHQIELKEAISRNKEQLCIKAIANHTQVPCNGTASSNFSTLCEQLRILCNNRKAKGDDISAYSGCVDGSGSLSAVEVRRLRAEGCASPNTGVARASGASTTTDIVLDSLNECSNERARVRAVEREEEIAIMSAILGAEDGN